MINHPSRNRVIRNLQNVPRRMHPAFLLCGMLVLLVSACSPQGASPANPPSKATTAPLVIASPNAPPATQPPAAKSALPSDPRAAVEYALRAQPKAFPFKVSTTIGSGSDQINTAAVIESPARIMMMKPNRSVIWVDGACYEKTGSAAWETCASPTTGQTAQASANALLDQATIEAGISIIKTVKSAGSETLNGISTQIYDYTSSGLLMGIQVDATTRMWVDEKTGLPIKVVTDSTAGGMTSTYTQLITYDSTLKVVTP